MFPDVNTDIQYRQLRSMTGDTSEDGNWRWDGFDGKPSQSASPAPKVRNGPPSPEQSRMNKRRLRGGPPSIEESVRNSVQPTMNERITKTHRPTYSEDGLWMWNGDEWIPSPPSGQPTVRSPPQPYETSPDRVSSGLSDKEQQNIVKNAYESGKKSIKLLVIFLLVSIPTAVICSMLTYETTLMSPEVLAVINTILVVGYLVVGGLIFGGDKDIEKFKILRSENPLDSRLDRGDKGLFMYKSSVYVWALPFILLIVAVIIAMFFFSISAKNNNKKY